MLGFNMRIGIIPARGGSKRIHKKNIKDFCGKPMIAWSIELLLECKFVDRVIVSTDDEEIADISKSLGAEVPFMRPKNLSDDFTPTIDVLSHAAQWIRRHQPSLKIDSICCLYATAPLATIEDINLAIDLMESSCSDYVFPVTHYDFPIQRALKINKSQEIEPAFANFIDSRSQDLETFYHDAGQFYWGRIDAWIERRSILSKNSRVIELPRWRVQDIDTPDDWIRAEKLFKIARL